MSRFVDSNDREIRRIQPMVDEANSLEAEFEALSDEQIRAQFEEVRSEIRELAQPDEPSDEELTHPDLERRRELKKARRKREQDRIQAALDDVLPEVFAMSREAMKRTLGMRLFDVQLIGSAVLHQGRISEMKTGEGKTLVGPVAAILNSLTGRGTHIVTVNDYLARRDPQWMGPVFHFLGVSLGMITHDASFVFEPDYPTTDERLLNLRPVSRREAYAADVTYGTNNEFGFDYLRDNMVIGARPAGPARTQLRDRRRGRQHPDRRGAHAAHHQRPGGGVGRPVLHLRPARAPAQGACRGRGGGRRLLHRPQGPRRQRRPKKASTRWRASSASPTCTTPIRAWLATSSRPCAPTPSTSATAITSSRKARSSSSMSSPVDRCPVGAGARASTRRSRPRRACASSARA
ncbi:MAG: hypothetical protein WKF78_08500 [Candidatus Limnocylindrales bacterium]